MSEVASSICSGTLPSHSLPKPLSMSVINVPASGAVSESLPASHLKPPPPSAASPVPIDWEPSTRQQQDEVNRHAANQSMVAPKKHPYNLHVTCLPVATL